MDIPDIDIDRIRGDAEWKSGPFIEYKFLDKRYLKQMFFDSFKFKIPPDNANLTIISYPGTSCHHDLWPVALNYYLDASDDDITYIYNKVNEDGIRLPELTFYEESDLVQVDSFVAKAKELVVLSTREIHKVVIKEPSRSRHILRMYWLAHRGITIDNIDTVFA